MNRAAEKADLSLRELNVEYSTLKITARAMREARETYGFLFEHLEDSLRFQLGRPPE